MANRFPLTIDGSTIKELASGDNLDLTGSGISISSNQGNANQVLISTGSGVAWADASGGSSTFGVSTMTGDGSDTTLTLSADPGSENNTQVYIDGVYQPKSSYSVSGTTLTFSAAPPTGTSVEAIVGASSSAGVPSDASVTSAKLSGALTTPSNLTLGGNLDVSGHDIVTVSNADIELDPNGSGTVIFKGNATKGAGQFKLNCENNSHGITIKGPPHSAAASYTLTLPNTDGSADQVLKTDGAGNLDWVDSGGGGGGGGMWAQVATTTFSSETFSLEFASLGSYTEWMIRFTGLDGALDSKGIAVIFDYGSGYVANNYRYKAKYFSSSSTGYDQAGTYSDRDYVPIILNYYNRPASPQPAHAFGYVRFTNTGAMFEANSHSNYQNYDYGLNHYQVVGSNEDNERATISKVKFVAVSGDSLTTSTNHGMGAGTFTLYGRVAS